MPSSISSSLQTIRAPGVGDPARSTPLITSGPYVFSLSVKKKNESLTLEHRDSNNLYEEKPAHLERRKWQMVVI